MATFDVRPFGLVTEVETTERGEAFHYKREIVEVAEGPNAPAEMRPFTQVGLALTGVVRNGHPGRHLVDYHVEAPDGSKSQLVQAELADWPPWALARTDPTLLRGTLSTRETLRPAYEDFPATRDWLFFRALEIRFELPGAHTFRMLIDAQRAAEYDLTVIYEREPHGQPQI